MNQVIFADKKSWNLPLGCDFIPVSLVNMSPEDASGEGTIADFPNEDFIINYMTPSNTIKTIEVNRETLSIQKINLLEHNSTGEYHYELTLSEEASNEGDAIQLIRQDAVPHQRNSWYIELNGNNRRESFWKQFKDLAKSNLLGVIRIQELDDILVTEYPFTIKFIGFEGNVITYVIKDPYQYLKMLLTKHIQNFGYNHTDDNAELNSGLADYKAWIADTVNNETVAVYRLRFATNRKASKTRDERVWQNVYICTKGQYNGVAAILDDYIAILNGEETEGGE